MKRSLRNPPDYLLVLALVPVLAFANQAWAATPGQNAPAAAADQAAVPAPKLQADLRALWHDHVVETRAYAMAVADYNTTHAAEAAQSVVANAKLIADAVGSFYGPAAGEQMLTLLGGHWGAVKALTDARRAGDAAAHDKALETLTANAGEIAKFLAGANPNLTEDGVKGLMIAHGAHHVAQIQQIMAGDTKGEATTWAAMQAHMDTIADALATAIAKQFPDKAS